MSIRVERTQFDDDGRCQYYVQLRPNASNDVHLRVPVEVAVSVAENGDLADLTFVLPKKYRTSQALTFLKKEEAASYVDPRVFIAFPGLSGDSVISAAANLEVDAAGRIIGLEIQ